MKAMSDVIGSLRFLWRQSKALPLSLETSKLQPIPHPVLDAYETNKEVVKTIFGDRHIRCNLLYHGTGALQYDGDKYGLGMTGQLRRPLDIILEEGLTPHTDPWALTEGSAQSVSFATAWSYAKYYADVYQLPADPLAWEYGNRAAWFSYFIVDTAKQTLKKAQFLDILKRRPRKNHPKRKHDVSIKDYSRLQRWALDVRRDITPQTSAIDIICGRTDITDNFGAILVMSEDDVRLATMRLGGTYEKRAARSVKPTKFMALAVPLNKVEEYTAKVRRLGYSFPVLAVEVVEYHMSRFSTQELTRAQRVR